MASMAILCAVLPILALAEREELLVNDVMFVQKRLALKPTEQADECPQTVSEDQMSRPVEDVVAESGGDGYCTFASIDPTIGLCAASRREKNMSSPFLDYYRQNMKNILDNPQATPFTYILPDGQQLVSRDHKSPWDDVYCLVNGLYDLPHRLASNFSFLEQVSEQVCQDVEKMFPNYHTFTAHNLNKSVPAMDLMVKQMMTVSSGIAHVDSSVIFEARRYLAVKCLMRGEGGGAVCDIAFCAARGCLRPDGHMLYSARHECDA